MNKYWMVASEDSVNLLVDSRKISNIEDAKQLAFARASRRVGSRHVVFEAIGSCVAVPPSPPVVLEDAEKEKPF